MTEHFPTDWQPAGRDPRAYTDDLRMDHGIGRNDRGEWVLLRHADVVAVATDDLRFSSAVSRFLQVPNGLDGARHRALRTVLDRYFTPVALQPFRDRFREVARRLYAELPRGQALDAVNDLGAVFAVRAQSTWLGWSSDLEQPLLDWMADNHAATRAGDLDATREVAERFDGIIRQIIAERRGADPSTDLTTRLLHEQVDGAALQEDELVSILRNWTGGDLGSIALCVGVIVHHLAKERGLQSHLRAGVSDADLDSTLDEILRIDDPFVSNRRRTTCPVDIGGVEIPGGEIVKLHWTSANRDAEVFGDPDTFDAAGNAQHNLVYGIGPHICPGRPLAALELRVAVKELLAETTSVELADGPVEREVAPVGGFRSVRVVLR